VTLSDLVSTIDSDRRHGNLSSAIRLFVLDHYRMQNGEDRISQSDPREIQSPRVVHSVLRAD
jgi:predicted DNA-binding ribbon-helix-helix protein